MLKEKNDIVSLEKKLEAVDKDIQLKTKASSRLLDEANSKLKSAIKKSRFSWHKCCSSPSG